MTPRPLDVAGGAHCVDGIVVPTRGPSPHLHRLIARLATLERAVSIVVDDADPAAADAVRAQTVAAGGTARFTVAGAAERAAWRAELARISGRPDVVDAALVAPPDMPWRIGALRNQLLLQGAGRVVLSIDDDVLPDVVAPTDHADGWRLSGAIDPTGWWPFLSRADAWQGATPVDPASPHEGVIGARAADLLGAAPDRHDVPPALEQEVAGGARVVLSTFGLAGDAGASRASIWLGAPADARARMLHDFPHRFTARTVLRAAPRATVSASPWFMAPCFAFDARAVLPPFFAVHRNTDGLWGMTLRRVAQSGLVAHLPLAIRHDPPDARGFELADLARDVIGFRMTDLLSLLLAVDPPAGDTPEARLRAAGTTVAALAHAAPEVRARRVHELARMWLAAMGTRTAAVRREGGPGPWMDALMHAELAVRAAIAAPPWPVEPRPGRSADETLADDLHRFAVTLEGWPELWAAATKVG